MPTTSPSTMLGRPNWLLAASCCPRRLVLRFFEVESRLKAIRNWRGETQLQLNFKTGIGQGYLSDLESGRRTGTPETIAKLAQALSVPVEWLS